MAPKRRATFAAFAVLAALLLSGCTANTPSGATIDSAGVVTVLYRPCVDDSVIGELDVFDDPDGSRPPVWSARLVDRAHGTRQLPIAPHVPGYAVTTTLAAPLDPGRTYYVDATDDAGVSLEGPSFKPRTLRPGQVREQGRFHELAAWTKANTTCDPSITERAILVGAAAVLVAAAAIVAAVIARRRRRLR